MNPRNPLKNFALTLALGSALIAAPAAFARSHYSVSIGGPGYGISYSDCRHCRGGSWSGYVGGGWYSPAYYGPSYYGPSYYGPSYYSTGYYDPYYYGGVVYRGPVYHHSPRHYYYDRDRYDRRDYHHRDRDYDRHRHHYGH